MTANIAINRCPFPVLGHHPFLVDIVVFCFIISYRNNEVDISNCNSTNDP